MKIIFHVDEFNRWDVVIQTVEYAVGYLEDHMLEWDVEILANGGAVEMLMKRTASQYNLHTILRRLSQKNVVFAACHQSIQNLDIDEGNVFSFVKVVPVGVIEIAEKQNEGYAYIKP